MKNKLPLRDESDIMIAVAWPFFFALFGIFLFSGSYEEERGQMAKEVRGGLLTLIAFVGFCLIGLTLYGLVGGWHFSLTGASLYALVGFMSRLILEEAGIFRREDPDPMTGR